MGKENLQKMKRLVLMIALIATILSCPSCNKQPTAMSKSEIEQDISDGIAQNFKYDKISDISFKQVETSSEEMEILKKKYQSQVEYATYECTATLENLDMIANVSYRMLVAYNAGKWEMLSCKEDNKDGWSYVAKKYPDERQILKDISTYTFGEFDSNYISNDKNTTIKIVNQSYDKTVSRETEELLITINTSFGQCQMHAKIIYYYLNGVWTIGDFICDDESQWSIIYNKGCELSAVSEKKVIDFLTNKNQFLTYTTSISYVDATKLSFIYNKVSDSSVTNVYDFSAVYDDFGTATYEVDIKYDWQTYEWSEPQVYVSLKSADFTDIIGKVFASKDKNTSFIIKDIRPISENEQIQYKNKKLSAATIVMSGQYKRGESTEECTIFLDIPLRDNDWNGFVPEKEFDIVFKTNDKSIVINSEKLLQQD